MEETSNEKSASQFPKFLIPVLLFVFVIAALAVYLIYLQSYQKTIAPKKTESAAATVNSQEISKKDYEAVVKVSTDQKQTIMDKLIKAEILDQYLKRSDVRTTDANIRAQILYDDDIDASEFLNGKIQLLTKKVKNVAGFADDRQFEDWYAAEKKKAKIVVLIEI